MKILLALFPIIFFFASCASKSKNAIQTVKITDNETRVVPERFVGLSFEKSILNTKIFSKDTDPTLKNLITQIGPGVLRFGGNQVDLHPWDLSQSTCRKDRRSIDHDSVHPLFQFAHELNWKVLYGLNLGCGTEKQAVDEVQAVLEDNNNDLLAFQIGNEPNLFPVNGLRPKDWNVKDFVKEFSHFQKTIQKKFPNAPISGPAFASLHSAYDKWFSPFLNETSGLSLITQHTYRLVPEKMALGQPHRSPTIENLLSDSNRLETLAAAKKFVKAAENEKLKIRISETNSAAGGGKQGVSDVYASTLWAAEHLFTLLDAGVDGVDFHGDPESDRSKDFYSPIKKIDGQYQAQPEYYGILFFKKMAIGHQLEVVNEKQDVPVYAFKNHNSLNVVLINLSPNKRTVRLKIPMAATQVKTYELSGLDLSRSDNINISGVTINKTGLVNLDSIQAEKLSVQPAEFNLKPMTILGLIFD